MNIMLFRINNKKYEWIHSPRSHPMMLHKHNDGKMRTLTMRWSPLKNQGRVTNCRIDLIRTKLLSVVATSWGLATTSMKTTSTIRRCASISWSVLLWNEGLLYMWLIVTKPSPEGFEGNRLVGCWVMDVIAIIFVHPIFSSSWISQWESGPMNTMREYEQNM